MSMFKEAVTAVCFAAIAMGAAELLLPDGGMKPQLRLLTGTVLIIAILTPCIGLLRMQPEQYIEDFSEYTQQQSLEQTAAKSYARNLSVLLSAAGVQDAKIQINTDMSESGSIQMKGATVYVKELEQDAEQLEQQLSAQLGVTVTVEEEQQNE